MIVIFWAHSLVTKLLTAQGDLWQSLQLHMLQREEKNLCPGPSHPVGAILGAFWTSAETSTLGSTGARPGHCLPLQLASPELWASWFSPFCSILQSAKL